MNRLSVILGICVLAFAVLMCNALQAGDEVATDELQQCHALSPTTDDDVEESIAEAGESIVGTTEVAAAPVTPAAPSAGEQEPLFELPAPRADLPSLILHRKGYTVSYNKETKQPNWVAWHLTAEHTDGEWARPGGNAFHEDAEVPAPRASNLDYKGSGWSRGHMCPAADNRWDSDAMYETFLLSNICPQHAGLNSGDWNDIEQECRRWARKYGGIYIVCGPVFYRQKHEVIGHNDIPVPEAFFKVVLCMNGTPRGIGFICKNTAGNRKTDFYVNTIAQVERITGYTFFPMLAGDMVSIVKDVAALDRW